MDITGLLAAKGHLLLVATGKGQIQQLVDLAQQSDSHIGVAGQGHPLLAGLTVAENIALPAMYHRNLSPEKVLAGLAAPIQALGVERTMELKPANLGKRDVLRIKILRCLARGCGVLLMPSPAPTDMSTALAALEAMNTGVRLWAVCLERQAPGYARCNLNPVSLREAS